MLRTDGTFTIYLVEHFFPKGASGFDVPCWRRSGDAGHFAANIPAELRFKTPRTGDGFLSPWRDFGASGECWQRTGVHGVFDPEVGMAYVALLTQYNPGTLFRLVEMKISQTTTLYGAP